jgi:hypothetical protein
MSNIIWESKLDNVYECKVVRISERKGQLTVVNGETKLLDQEVGLSYGATFGPDMDDVAYWQDLCVAKIDEAL